MAEASVEGAWTSCISRMKGGVSNSVAAATTHLASARSCMHGTPTSCCCLRFCLQEMPTQAETAALCSSGLVEVLATLLYEQPEVTRRVQHPPGSNM
jgi:hypothetical protein